MFVSVEIDVHVNKYVWYISIESKSILRRDIVQRTCEINNEKRGRGGSGNKYQEMKEELINKRILADNC